MDKNESSFWKLLKEMYRKEKARGTFSRTTSGVSDHPSSSRTVLEESHQNSPPGTVVWVFN
jgi:hypothetical protein